MGAIAEQLTHTGHIRSVEIGKVEACQTIAIHKHAAIPIITTAWPLSPRTVVAEYLNPIAHGNDIGGVEIGEVKACQSAATPNMASMCFTFEVLKLDTFRLVRFLHPSKSPRMSVTWEVLKLERSRLVRLLQPANIPISIYLLYHLYRRPSGVVE